MSFSKDTKKDLCSMEVSDENKLHALVYGMVLFSKQFSPAAVSFTTECKAAAAYYSEMVSSLTGAIVETTVQLTRRGGAERLYTVCIPDKNDCKKVFDFFGHSDRAASLRINRSNIYDDECLPYFLRGAFLVCGNVASPEKDYHMEFVVVHMNLANDLCKIISETEINPKGIKSVCRKGNYIVYTKGSESIADILGYIGAQKSYFDILDAKIVKSLRNNANRQTNFDMANSKKTAFAAARQLEAIRIIREAGEISNLSDDLKELALLREEHPEYNLRDLGEALTVPISRSGVNHRLARLIEIAGNISGKPV